MISDQPLVINRVIFRMAIGNDAINQGLTGRLAIDALTQMGRRRQDAVARQHPLFRRARPNHILAQKRSIWKLRQGRHRCADHALIARRHHARHPHHNVWSIVVMQRRDAAIFPNLLGDADDVIGEIGEFRVKPLHDDHPLGMRAELRKMSSPSISIQPGSGASLAIWLIRSSTVLSTIRLTGCLTVVRS